MPHRQAVPAAPPKPQPSAIRAGGVRLRLSRRCARPMARGSHHSMFARCAACIGGDGRCHAWCRRFVWRATCSPRMPLGQHMWCWWERVVWVAQSCRAPSQTVRPRPPHACSCLLAIDAAVRRLVVRLERHGVGPHGTFFNPIPTHAVWTPAGRGPMVRIGILKKTC